MSTTTKLAPHPAAELFPMMDDASLRELAEDIRANGQREWCELYQGKIIDGRNRVKACELIGVEPETCEIEDEIDPVAYVLSKNLYRRHLNESQRAFIAADAEKMYASAAKERQKRKSRESLAAPVQQQNGRAAEKAAAIVGVGVRSIYSAKKVVKDGAPEVADAIRAGRLSVKVAEKLVRAVPDKQRQLEIIRSELREDSETRQNDSRVKSRLWFLKEGREPAQKPNESEIAARWQYASDVNDLRNGLRLVTAIRRLEIQCNTSGDDLLAVIKAHSRDKNKCALAADIRAAKKAVDALVKLMASKEAAA